MARIPLSNDTIREMVDMARQIAQRLLTLADEIDKR